MSYTIPRKFEELERRIRLLEEGGVIERSSVHEYDSLYEFPSIGQKDNIYIDCSNNKIYRWDSDRLVYQLLSSYEDIDIINGGTSRNG